MGLAKSLGAALLADKIFAHEAYPMEVIWEAAPDEMFASHWQNRASHLAAGTALSDKHVITAIQSSFSNSEAD